MDSENAKDADKTPVTFITRRLADIPPEASGLGAQRAQTQKEKRTRAAEKKRARNVGQLKSMLGMPVDVLFEIASHLHPLDLLYLSRVSTDFRALFATRAARHMWVASRRNVPYLPDCPQDLSELAYARLMFEIDCEACGRVPRSNAVYISYNVRVHFCKQCYDLNVKKGSTILRTFNKATRSRIPETIFSMLPTYDISYRDGAGNRDWNSYYKPELELVVNEYFKLTDLAERDEFVRRRQTLTNMLMETGRELQTYKQTERTLKGKELQKLLSDRKIEIESKLAELGYTEDDLAIARRYVSWQWSQLIEQPRPLTALGWNIIRPKLAKAIEDSKARETEARRSRLKSERSRETNSTYMKFLSKTMRRREADYVRHEVDFSKLPSVRTLVEAEDYTIPVTLDRLTSASANVLADCRDHRQVIRRDLAMVFLDRAVKEDTDSADIDVDAVLSSAIALFGCQCRREPFPLEEFLVHRHFTCRREDWTSSMKSQRDVTPSDFKEYYSWNYPMTLRAYSRDMSRAAGDVLTALSLPRDTKLDSLVGKGRRFSCACNQGSAHGANEAMTFIGLVAHVVEQRDIVRRVASKCSMAINKLSFGMGHLLTSTRVRYTGAEVHEDHEAALLPSLVSLSPTSIVSPTSSCTDVMHPRNICTLCHALGGELIQVHCPMEAATHMKQKHALDDVLDYYLADDLTMLDCVRKLYEARPNLPV